MFYLIRSMTNDKLLNYLHIHTEEVLPDYTIPAVKPSFIKLLGIDPDSNPVSLFDAVPELIGLEDSIEALFLGDGSDPVSLEGFYRNGNYLSLQLFPAQSVEKGQLSVTIVVRDVSEMFLKQQEIQQQRNEISLLDDQLRQQNSELIEVNSRLDSLLHEVRKKGHTLNMEILQQTRELNDSRLWFITTLARAAEFRELETGGHIYRIGRSSVLIGKARGLSPGECSTLFYACLLHDVGKIGIPDSILLKRGPLSGSDWEMMKKHTQIGAELLSNNSSELFLAAREVALHHHEHWDGLGYPNGLRAKEIPLRARICAVADVFDALISERVYKKAWSVDQAVDEIRSQQGKHFDPEIVQAFLDVLPDILNLRNHSGEECEMLEPEFL